MALAAVTVKVDKLPAVIEVGLAVTATVGGMVDVLTWAEPHPANKRGSTREEIAREKNGKLNLKL